MHFASEWWCSLQRNIQGNHTQLQLVYKAFHNKPLTMKEVFVEIGVLREFVCWYCRELRLSGKLYFIKKRRCSITNRYVKEFTTNEIFLQKFPTQLNLFE